MIDIDPGPIPVPPQPRPRPIAGLTSEFDRVNVLWIDWDDLGIEQIRAFGIDTTNTYARLPNFEWLIANGVRFPRHYSMPVCSPTRSARLTGRYPFRTGLGQQVTSAQNALPLTEMCLPRAITLGTADRYRLAGFGKWHLSNWMNGNFNHPSTAGFERYVMTMANLERGDDDYFSHTVIDDKVARHSRKYSTTEQVDDALTWINSVEEPWFCYVAFNSVHEPIHRPPDHYDTETYVLPNTEPQGLEDPRPYLKAMEQNTDFHMGRLFRGIRPEQFANTFVIVTSDNGTSGGLLPDINGGVAPGHNKGSVYEFGIRVPMVVMGPGVDEPGRSCPGLVSCVDLYPTIAEICGADLAQAPSAGTVDGVSFVNMIRDRAAPSLRPMVFAEVFTPNGQVSAPYNGPAGQRTLITQRYKIVIRATGPMPHTTDAVWAGMQVPPVAVVGSPSLCDQFFDLQAPNSGILETVDLLGNNGSPLGGALDDVLASTTDGLVHEMSLTAYNTFLTTYNAAW